MRYHINKNNEPAPCHAKSPESCPCRGNGDVDENGDLIGNGHYKTREAATQAIEHKFEMKNRGYAQQIRKQMSRVSPAGRSGEGTMSASLVRRAGMSAVSRHRSADSGNTADVRSSRSRISVADFIDTRRRSGADAAQIQTELERHSIVIGRVAEVQDENGMTRFKNIPYKGATSSSTPYVEETGNRSDWNVELSDYARSRKWSPEEFNKLTELGVFKGTSGSTFDYGYDFSVDEFSADSAFVWKVDEASSSATGVWMMVDTTQEVKLTDPIPLSSLKSLSV